MVRWHNKSLLKTHFSFFPCNYFSPIAIFHPCLLLKEMRSRISVNTLKRNFFSLRGSAVWDLYGWYVPKHSSVSHGSHGSGFLKPCPIPGLPGDLRQVISPLCLSVPTWLKGVMIVNVLHEVLLFKAPCNMLHELKVVKKILF